MNKIWFVRKRYGWGWIPATWEGWIVLLVYVVLVLAVFRHANRLAYSEADALMLFLIPFVILTALLLLVSYWRGESPRWQWGRNDTDIK